MRIPEGVVEQIKQTADILEVVGDFVSLKKRGSNYTACCPFHNEKSPSFNVNPTRQIYKCFGCGKAGDAVKFVMDIEQVSYGEALRFLAKKYAIELPEVEATPEELLRQNERDSLFIVLNFAKTYYQELLKTHPDGQTIGRSYFRERGFTDPTIDAFELGYSLDKWDGLLLEAQKRGYNPDILDKAGLIIRKHDAGQPNAGTPERARPEKMFDRFRARVMFPIHNVSGRVIAFGARILKVDKDKSQPKYLNSPETEVYHKSQVLYGIFQAKQTIRQEDVCYLTEGYTDVISLHQAGIKNVVASSGTSLTLEQIRLISRFTPNVTILYDGDAAGIKAALRGLDMVLEEGLNVSVVTFPDGEDPDSYVRKVGAEAFREYLKTKAYDFIRFKTEILLRDAGQNPFKRAEVITEIVGSISRIPDAIKRQVFFRTTAQQLQVDEQTLISESNRLIRKQADAQAQSRERQQPVDRAATPSNQPSAPPTNFTAEPPLDELDQLLADAGIHTPPPADDHWPTEAPPMPAEAFLTPPATPAAAAQRSALSYQEEECIRLLLNYGTRELEPGFTLCRYMLEELNNIVFQTPPYDRMLAQFRESFAEGVVLTADHFLNDTSDESGQFQRTAIHLTTNRHELSEGWKKHEIFVPTEEQVDILSLAAYTNILRVKKLLAEQQMHRLKQQIATVTDPDQSDELMRQYMHYKRADVEIAKILGVVISG